MAKRLFFVIFLLQSLSSESQSNISGRFSLSAGFDVGAHLTLSESRYQNTVVDQDTNGAATKLFQFNAHYSFAKWFSAGLGFRTGSYIEDQNDPDTKYKSNDVREFYLDTRFYYVNRDKINLYAGLSLGSTNLHINYNNVVRLDSYYKAGSFRVSFFGMNWYISKYVGLWLNMDYALRNFKLNRYTINETAQDLTDFKATLQTKGVHFAIGACFKFK